MTPTRIRLTVCSFVQRLRAALAFVRQGDELPEVFRRASRPWWAK